MKVDLISKASDGGINGAKVRDAGFRRTVRSQWGVDH